MLDAVHEEFTPEEREALAPFFTDLDGPVFCVVNLPEVVKGALFARYSRTSKTLRRLFLDEFLGEGAGDLGRATAGLSAADVGVERAEKLYERVFSEFGDDSVAQLGGVHLAAEQASQILTKVLERGRLAAYLEQSTRYVPYDDRPGGRYRYHVPPEVDERGPGRAGSARRATWRSTRTPGGSSPLQEYFRERFPQDPADSDGVYRATIRAKACDTLRGLLPAAARTHVGMYATAQSYESLLLRMRSHPLAEVRAYGDAMLVELRKVIPAFLTRVDKPDRGGAWSDVPGRDAGRPRPRRRRRRSPALVPENPSQSTTTCRWCGSTPRARRRSWRPRMYPHASHSQSAPAGGGPRDVGGRAVGGPARGGRRSVEPPAPAGPRVRGDVVPVRRPLRLRRLPRPPAPPAAHGRVAAPDARSTARTTPEEIRGPRRRGRLGRGARRLAGPVGHAADRRAGPTSPSTPSRWRFACAS